MGLTPISRPVTAMRYRTEWGGWHAIRVAVIGAAFLLSWAAEVAQHDIPRSLALTILALIAVLPEYAVDMYLAWRAAEEPAVYGPLALVNPNAQPVDGIQAVARLRQLAWTPDLVLIATPPAVVERLTTIFSRAIQSAKFKAWAEGGGAVVDNLTGASLGREVNSVTRSLAEVGKKVFVSEKKS